MSQAELISACIKNDKTARKQFFDTYVGKLSYISLRYSKNASQSEQVLLNGFSHIFSKLPQFKAQNILTLDEFIKNEFITFAVTYLKGIRNEYYVASTVKAVEYKETSYDLFLDSKFIDLKNINHDVLLKSIQALVPSQRLVFNLHVIDNYTLAQASELLDTSEQSIKSNLEKARFNLQKTIERNLKLSNDEQPV
ncbi:MAG: polymerase sigma factor [Bacteroidota bacterium]|jgi:RNA polymerase sigma-70 factor (ECF subfamily)|nr:polymerase sigma factor [Bacteroidota bacterium]